MSFLDLIWLIPLLPLAGAAINGIFGKWFSKKAIAGIAASAVVMSFLTALGAFLEMIRGTTPVVRTYFTWIEAGSFRAMAGFHLDELSGLMALIVTGVGLLIHIYSASYMSEESGFYRYFAYLNLFMFSMLTLVLADNYLLMFVGWEGVGLCSYLLIGFWFSKQSATDAGKKAFIVNRVGDFGFILAALLMFWTFGGVDFDAVGQAAIQGVPPIAPPWAPTAICLLLLLGATGKSAQIPLYVWLPDAMEGPTPVSALIHAATMVTAGVYMMARSAVLFEVAPTAMMIVAVIGTATAFFAATIALVQTDIKRVLAYSTVSQLGYMFMACGVGAWAAAVFHLMTHAFFKALLFLGAGSVIHGMGGVQDLRKMGGVRHQMPWTYRTFLIGGLALAGIPGLAGFFSKDAILWGAWSRPGYGPLLWTVGVATAGLTSFYTFRLIFLVFFGEARYTPEEAAHVHESPAGMIVPLLLLGAFSIGAGYIGVPAVLGGGNHIEHFLEPVVGPPALAEGASHMAEFVIMGVSVAAGIAGLIAAWLVYGSGRGVPGTDVKSHSLPYRILEGKYYIDELYGALVVTPLVWLSKGPLWKGVDGGVIDGMVNGTASWVRHLAGGLRRVQGGYLRSYAGWILAGGALMVAWFLGL